MKKEVMTKDKLSKLISKRDKENIIAVVVCGIMFLVEGLSFLYVGIVSSMVIFVMLSFILILCFFAIFGYLIYKEYFVEKIKKDITGICIIEDELVNYNLSKATATFKGLKEIYNLKEINLEGYSSLKLKKNDIYYIVFKKYEKPEPLFIFEDAKYDLNKEVKKTLVDIDYLYSFIDIKKKNSK